MRHLIFLIVLVWLVAGSCSESPYGPTGGQPYKLYFWDEGDHKQYYSYDPVDNKVDSFWLPYRSIEGKISPDGRYMWSLTLDGGAVVMDIVEREVVHQFPANEYLDILISPDGRYAALLGYNLSLVRTHDFGIVYSDTVNCSRGVFTRSGTGLYYLSNGIWRLDLSNGFEREFIDLGDDANPWVCGVLPTGDESALYMYLRGRYYDYMSVYHFATDSLETFDAIYVANHVMAFTKDEKWLLVTTQPPEVVFDLLPEYVLQVYDTETSKPVWEQTYYVEMISGDSVTILPTDLVVTPDYKWAVLIGWEYDGRLIAIDLETMKGVYSFEPGIGHRFRFLSCSSDTR